MDQFTGNTNKASSYFIFKCLILAFVVIFSSLYINESHAQTALEKKQASVAKSLDRKLARVKKSVEKLQNDKKKDSPFYEKKLKRSNKSIEKQLESALKKRHFLAPKEKNQVSNRVETIRKNLSDLIQQLKNKEAQVSNKKDKKQSIPINSKKLDKKQKSVLKKAQKKIKNIEKSVAKIENHKHKDAGYFKDLLDTTNDKVNKQVASILKSSKKLPKVDLKKLTVILSELKKRLTIETKLANSRGEEKTKLKNAWTDYRQSSEYSEEKQFLKSVQSLQSYLFELRNNRFKAISDEDLLESISLISSLPQMQSRVNTLQDKYNSMGKSALEMKIDANSSQKQIDALSSQLEATKQEGIAFLISKDKELHDGVTKTYEAKANSERLNHNYSLDYVLMDKSSPVPRTVRIINRASRFLAEASKEKASEYIAQAKKSTDYYDSVIDKMTAEIVLNKKLPLNDYSGADRKALEQFVHSQFPKENLLGVYLRGNWYQEKKKVWVPSNSSFKEINRSSLEGKILTKFDDKWAVERWVRVIKDHTHSDKLVLQKDNQPNPNPRPAEKILLEKI